MILPVAIANYVYFYVSGFVYIQHDVMIVYSHEKLWLRIYNK